MSNRSPVTMLFTLWLFAGCVGASKPTVVAPIGDAPPAAELVSKGKEAARRGDAVRAEQYLAMAIQHGAVQADVMPELLRACLRSAHLRAALNHAQPYLLEHPADDALRYLVATIHVGLGQREAARRELNLLLDRSPSDSDGHYLLGILDADFDVPSAKNHFETAITHTQDEDRRVEIQSRLSELRLREPAWSEVEP